MKKLLIAAPLLLSLISCSDELAREDQVQQLFDLTIDKTESCMSELAAASGASEADMQQAVTMMKAMLDSQKTKVFQSLQENKVLASDVDSCISAMDSIMSDVSCKDLMQGNTPAQPSECTSLSGLANPFAK